MNKLTKMFCSSLKILLLESSVAVDDESLKKIERKKNSWNQFKIHLDKINLAKIHSFVNRVSIILSEQ